MGAKKKDIPRIHMDKYILQKTGSKLVIFGLCGLIYNLHPHIWGRHRVLYFTTQMTENLEEQYASLTLVVLNLLTSW